jgi:Xaa-Pro dipeptidase
LPLSYTHGAAYGPPFLMSFAFMSASKYNYFMLDKWTDNQVQQHKTAADLCYQIMQGSFELIRGNHGISEYDVQQYILIEFQKRGMTCDKDIPIVAYRENTSFVHYYPEASTAKKLEPNSLIMIDLWARLNEQDAPYADITWMAWYGSEIPDEFQKAFDVVTKSRDSGLEYIQGHLSEEIMNSDLAKNMEQIVLDSGLQEKIPHSFGHSLGTNSPHGVHGSFWQDSKQPLIDSVGYTIEPGIYFEDKFGIRSEIDFYVSQNKELVVTTKVQRKIELI